jgi:hypothetical protein
MQFRRWIDFSRVTACHSEQERDLYIKEMLEWVTEDNPIYLSDILINLNNGGQIVLEYLFRLEDEARMRRIPTREFLIHVIRKRDGNKPKSGEKIIRIYKQSLYKDKEQKKPYSATELSAAIRDGSYAERFEVPVPFTVDEKGCIVVGLSDAIYFLNLWGIHGITKIPLQTKPERNGNVWYHLYEEWTRKMWEEAENMEKGKNK